MMRHPLFLTLLLSMFFVPVSGGMLYAQLADRVVITGIVTDTSGAAVPDAKVTVINQDTSSKTVVGTNSVGNYSTPPLILGTYSVQVEKEGFKVFTRSGIVVTGGDTYRQDVQLEVGALTWARLQAQYSYGTAPIHGSNPFFG